jgi:hypothetical protein
LAEQNFISWYKDKAEHLSQDVPAEVWTSIENQLDIEEVWTGVEDDLDINDVWKKISRELDYLEAPVWQKPVGYALILSLLLFFSVSRSADTVIKPALLIVENPAADCLAAPEENADERPAEKWNKEYRLSQRPSGSKRSGKEIAIADNVNDLSTSIAAKNNNADLQQIQEQYGFNSENKNANKNFASIESRRFQKL